MLVTGALGKVTRHPIAAGSRHSAPTEVTANFIDEHQGRYGVEPICEVQPTTPSAYNESWARLRDSDRRPVPATRAEILSAETRWFREENIRLRAAEKVWRPLRR